VCIAHEPIQEKRFIVLLKHWQFAVKKETLGRTNFHDQKLRNGDSSPDMYYKDVEMKE
jgi:hypothetical protein